MKQYHLIVGDNSIQLAEFAKMMFSDSMLITRNNYKDFFKSPARAGYTSLADLGPDQLTELAKNATEIHYWPPLIWASELLHQATTEFLNSLIIRHNLKIHNFSISVDPLNSLSLMDTRSTDHAQLWATGCSYAHGFGLESKSQRYIDKISTELNLSVIDLTSPASSIDWAADQILRSDIRKNDLVCWGVTSINRMAYYINGRWVPILPNLPEFISGCVSSAEKKFFNKLILDDNRLIQSIKNIYQVINFVKKAQADIVIFYHRELSNDEHTRQFEPYLYNTGHYVSITDQIIDQTDDGHPGPKTNQMWADEILFYLYNRSATRFNKGNLQ